MRVLAYTWTFQVTLDELKGLLNLCKVGSVYNIHRFDISKDFLTRICLISLLLTFFSISHKAVELGLRSQVSHYWLTTEPVLQP